MSNTDDLRKAVTGLIDPARKRLMLDDGSVIWAIEMSLWDQLADALATGTEQGTHGVPASRPPCDVDIAELRRDVEAQVETELLRLRKPRRDTVEESARALAALIASQTDEDLIEWWELRFRRWGRRAQTLLGEITRPRGIRGAQCPNCEVTWVNQPGADGSVRVAALTIVFHERRVRHAECLHCRRTWWRGEELLQLADILSTPTAANDTPLAAS